MWPEPLSSLALQLVPKVRCCSRHIAGSVAEGMVATMAGDIGGVLDVEGELTPTFQPWVLGEA